jgi:hypothetical protein
VAEVVLAVDERAHPATTAACADLADSLFVVPAAMGLQDRYLGWLHNSCTGEWILRADDDELPSAALRAALPGLLAEREPTHYWVPGRWAFPDQATYIADGIWMRDIHVRLVRNVPGIWRFSGRLHSNIEVLGASRVLAEPLLHLVLLVSDIEQRRAKVARYETLMPGLRHQSGVPVNAVYVPEDIGERTLAPLADQDAAAISAFMAASRRPIAPTRRDVDIRPVRADDLERWNLERPVSPGAYKARIRLPHGIDEMRARELQHVQVEVTNLGDAWWPRGPDPGPQIQLGHRWQKPDGTDVAQGTPRTPFTETVAPGATTRLTIAIQAPHATGRLELRVDVVHEFVRWFDCEARLTVDVLPR